MGRDRQAGQADAFAVDAQAGDVLQRRRDAQQPVGKRRQIGRNVGQRLPQCARVLIEAAQFHGPGDVDGADQQRHREGERMGKGPAAIQPTATRPAVKAAMQRFYCSLCVADIFGV